MLAQQIADTASVVDGDATEIEDQRPKLNDIDAPELEQRCRLEGAPWRCGKDAAAALAWKVGQRLVTCEQEDKSKPGHVIAKCSVGGEDLGEWMVLNGWAVALYLYSYEYSRAETLARANQRGIWASEFEAPWAWRKERRQ